MASSLTDDMATATRWLASIQDEASGGWGEYQGALPNALNTAEALLALLDGDQYTAGDTAIQRGAAYLAEAQLRKEKGALPRDDGAWCRLALDDTKTERHLPDTVHSVFALLALNCTGKPTTDPTIQKGLDWLVRIHNKDGGWGHAAGKESRLLPTCQVLDVLLRLYQADDSELRTRLHPLLEQGLRHLRSYCNDEGSFGRQPGLEVAHSLYVIRTLRLAQSQGFGVEGDNLERAVRWIRAQGGTVMQWVNEKVEISADDIGAYTFTHITPALFLYALGPRLSADDPIAIEGLKVMHDSMDPVSGGFSGKRPVSWATAKALLGLGAVATIFDAFPSREIETGEFQARNLVLPLLLVVILATTAVSLAGKISVEFSGVMMLIIFAGLLGYGLISEGTFAKLARLSLRLWKNTDKD